MKALIVNDQCAVEELDLAVATPDERDRAITNVKELDMVLILVRKENEHELD